jgi:hypothetical protein
MSESVKRDLLQKAYLMLDKALQEKKIKEVLKQMEIINNLNIKLNADN